VRRLCCLNEEEEGKKINQFLGGKSQARLCQASCFCVFWACDQARPCAHRHDSCQISGILGSIFFSLS